MSYIRQEIRGTSPQDIMKINENLMGIYEKVFGDINFSDVDKVLQTRINTQWLQVQGDGNLDKNYPLYIRFFIPPNVKEISSSSFNVICENYRMDSSITSSIESKQEVVNIVSSAEPSSNQTSTSAPQQTISSTSGASGISSVGGGGVTSNSGGGRTAYVDKWGNGSNQVTAPTDYVYPNNMTMISSNLGGFITSDDSRLTYGALCPDGKMNGSAVYIKYVDLYSIQHSHSIPDHTHYVPNHSHSIALNGHSHEITIPPHNHSVTVPAHSHTVNGSVTIPAHNHSLNEGIKVSSVSPSNVGVYCNDVLVTTLDGTNATKNDLDFTPVIKIGQWNTIKITTSNLARITLYGTVEVVTRYNK